MAPAAVPWTRPSPPRMPICKPIRCAATRRVPRTMKGPAWPTSSTSSTTAKSVRGTARIDRQSPYGPANSTPASWRGVVRHTGEARALNHELLHNQIGDEMPYHIVAARLRVDDPSGVAVISQSLLITAVTVTHAQRCEL